MDPAKRLHSISAHLLLIAVAIQGFTPDADDLASLRALHVLCPFTNHSSPWEDQEDLPDEICEAVQPGTKMSVRGMVEETPARESYPGLSDSRQDADPSGIREDLFDDEENDDEENDDEENDDEFESRTIVAPTGELAAPSSRVLCPLNSAQCGQPSGQWDRSPIRRC
jgi:hypothetical protein